MTKQRVTLFDTTLRWQSARSGEADEDGQTQESVAKMKA